MTAQKVEAKKHLGQNFLRNTDILRKIVGESSLLGLHVVEVGPGPGDLTAEILNKNPDSLSVIEIDSDMIPLLQKRFSKDQIELYWSDVLKINISKGNTSSNKKNTFFQVHKEIKEIIIPEYELYGNIPYYITSPIIYHFFYTVNFPPNKATFTMQKEVAERILARDGKHSVLSVSCQLVADVEKVCDINPQSFDPVPKVWSSCLRFTLKKDVSIQDSREIIKIVKQGFSQKRKKLMGNLSQIYSKEKLMQIFHNIRISPDARAEDLKIDNWKELYAQLGHCE